MLKQKLEARVVDRARLIEGEFWARQESLGKGSRVVGFFPRDIGHAGFVTNVYRKDGATNYIIKDDNGDIFEVAGRMIGCLKIQGSRNPGYAPEMYQRVLKRYKELFHNGQF